MGFFTIKHSMPAGDLLSLLPGLRQVCTATGNKVIIYQQINLKYGAFAIDPDSTYSIKNEDNIPVTMSRPIFEALRPLLLHQDFVQDFVEWNGEETNFNFDILRQQESTMPYGSINRWPFYIYPDMACDLSKPWLDVRIDNNPSLSDKIIINRTERYNNMLISYNFLKKYGEKVLFVGLPNEHRVFCQQHKLDISRLETEDLLEMAVALKSCKLYIGNQSAIFQISEGLKINRVLEACKQMPNVIGSGPGFYDFLNQYALEYYVQKLFNE